jgi:hypothetical protein
MKKILTAGLVAGLVAVAAPASHAAGYVGGCGFDAINDTTPGGLLGGPDRYNGVIEVAVIATDDNGVPALLPLTVRCDMYVDGVFVSTALAASGVGVAAAAGTFSFHVDGTQIVEICDVVSVGGQPETVQCAVPA